MSLRRDTDPVEDGAETEFPTCSVCTYDTLRLYTETVLSSTIKIQTAEYPVACLGGPWGTQTFHFRDLPCGAQQKAALERAAEQEHWLVLTTPGAGWKSPSPAPAPAPAHLLCAALATDPTRIEGKLRWAQWPKFGPSLRPSNWMT